MNRKFLLGTSALLVYVLASFLAGCSSSNNNNHNNNTPASIAATTGSGQSATVSTAFSKPLVATVTNSSGSPVSGVSVTFTVVAGSSGASAAFATGGATDTETTGSNGQATTSQTLTANATAGTFTVTAAVSGVSTPATFTFTNTAVVVTTSTYVFYAGGTEVPNTQNGLSESYYALAGAVSVDANGNVVSGEEDYNDGNGSPQGGTTPVSITSGTLTVNATTGQGTLTLVTNSSFVGNSGTETLGVQFANTDHALIIQFDGTATSSGSLDLQTASSGGGNYAFVLAGVDWNYAPVGYGGVYSVSSKNITGVADVNDAGTLAPGNTFTGSSGSPDSLGRGTATVAINGTTLALIYYNVGPEVIRLIDMDPGGTEFAGNAAVGSAYGQGSSTTFSASSLTNSVIGLEADPFGFAYATAGSIIPTPTSGTNTGTFTGTVDDNEEGATAAGAPFSGTYSVSNSVGSTTYNGYSNLAISSTNSPFFHVSNLGVYMTDPALNLLDPNNTSGGGGALVLDLDADLSGGTGMVIPQTDFATTSFSGNYALGAQEYFTSGGIIYEFDYLGQGSVASLALTGSGLVSDPFAFFGPTGYTPNDPATMSGTATADPNEATNGRYTMPFTVDAFTGSASDNLSIAIYQASGGTLLFMESSKSLGSLGFGSFQQQGSLTGLPAKRSPVKKAQKNIKH